jgi:hypothetical protein
MLKGQRIMTQTTTLIIVLLVGAAVLVIAVVGARQSRTRRQALRRRFGPEYERALLQYGSAARAERELAKRAKRMERFHLRALDDVKRARFAAAWNEIQGRFIDDPAQAVRQANDLIKDAMLALGYPADRFEQRTADLSVHHPGVVQHYRAAHALAESGQTAEANTEDLRQAVVHYRALFSELIERKPAPSDAPARELPAWNGPVSRA